MTRIHVPGKNCVVLNDPDVIADVLIHKTDDYWRDRPRGAVLPVATDDSAFISPGGNHWAERRAWHPQQHEGIDAWLDARVQGLVPVIQQTLERWVDKGAQEASDVVNRLTCDLLFAASYDGGPVSDDEYDLFMQVATALDSRMQWRWPFRKPIWGAEQKAYDDWQSAGEVRFDAQTDEGSLPEIMRKAALLDKPSRMARGMNAVLLEGGFSSGSGISSTLWQLTQHPDEAKKVADAVAALPRPLTWKSIDACEPLDHALREAMRILPPVPIFFRNSTKERSIELGGYELPPNTVLFVTNWLLQRESDHWEDPSEFRPSRWENGVAAANPYGSGHFSPFGRGPRSCAGERLALLVQKTALAVLLSEGSIEVGKGQGEQQLGFFFATLRMDNTSLIAKKR